MRRIAFALFCLLLVGSSFVFAQEDGTLEHINRQRDYHVFVPSGYDASTATPLVIALHGATDTGQHFMESTGYKNLAEVTGYLVAYPEGVQNTWGYLDRKELASTDTYINDWDFVKTLIEQLKKDYNVDPKRVYVVGFSAGGLLALRMACEYSDELAGVAVISANLNQFLAGHCMTANPVPLLMILGTKDELFPWSGVISRRQSNRLVITFSIQQTVAFFTDMNGCKLESAETKPISTAFSPVQVVETAFTDCRRGANFVLDALVDYPHHYPLEPFITRQNDEMGTIEDAVWEFFMAHPGNTGD